MSDISESTTPVIVTALSTTEDSNRLRYSADGNDVILRTRIGDMNFSSDEFTFYQLLFKIADINNTGRLTSTTSHLTTLLNRTGLNTIQLDTILSHVNGKSNIEGNEVQGLSFNQWLVLCKLIAYTQRESTHTGQSYIPNDDALEQVHISPEPFHIADFSFGKTKDVQTFGLTDDFVCEIKGYKVHGGEGFQQHIKFTISTSTTTTTTTSPLPSLTSATNTSSTSPSIISSSSSSSLSSSSSYSTAISQVNHTTNGHKVSSKLSSNGKASLSKKNENGNNSSSSSVSSSLSSSNGKAKGLTTPLPNGYMGKALQSLHGLSLSNPIQSSSSSSIPPVQPSTLSIPLLPTLPLCQKQSVSNVEIVRRYSDFELLSSVLQRFYPGSIVPPLPPKSWGFSSVSDAIGLQRSRELQMFLNHVTKHPFLRHTYEVKAFLEASAAGFRAFRELFPRLIVGDGPTTLSSPRSSSTTQSNTLITNILGVSSTAASYAATNAVAIASNVTSSISQTKAYSYVSNIFDSVRTVISAPLSLATVSTTSSSSQPIIKENAKLDTSVKDSLKFEENVGIVASKLEQVLVTEGKMTYELSQMAYYMKQMADYGNNTYGGAEIDLQHTYEYLEQTVVGSQKTLDIQIRLVLSPMQYTGRYFDSLKAVVSHKELVMREIESSVAKEVSIKKSLDQARTSMTQSPELVSTLSTDLEIVSKAIESSKKKDFSISSSLDNELGHLRQTTVQEVESSKKAFVNARLETARQNLDILEKLRNSLLDSKTWRPEVSGVLLLDEFV